MTLIRRLAWWIGQELAGRPEARAKAKEVLAKTQRVLNDDVKPRAQQAWRDAQPEIASARRKLKQFTNELRDEYRKGRTGE